MGKGCTQVYKYTSVYRGSVELFNLEISVQKHFDPFSKPLSAPCFHAAADVTYAMCVSSKVTTVQRGFLLMRFIKLRSSIIKDVRCMLCCVVIKTCHPPTQHIKSIHTPVKTSRFTVPHRNLAIFSMEACCTRPYNFLSPSM